jgi:Ni/Co efflux regulator RcnB
MIEKIFRMGRLLIALIAAVVLAGGTAAYAHGGAHDKHKHGKRKAAVRRNVKRNATRQAARHGRSHTRGRTTRHSDH